MMEVAVMDEDWKTRAERAEAERAEARAELQRQQRLRTSEAGKYLADVAALRAEVERLRRQLEDWKHSLAEQEKVSEAFMRERDALRLALAAAYRLMNHMGDILNDMDAVEEEDEKMATPVFEQVRAALGLKEDG